MNEPVAWMLADKEAEHIRSIMAVQHDFVPEGCVEIPLYTHPVKELTDEEIDLVREVLNGCVSSIKTEIDQELQTFKGYEHCSNLPSLESELKDAEKAMEILRKAQEK
jgi:hypothetical protein